MIRTATRTAVELAILRGTTSNKWLMDAFDLTYDDVVAIRQRMGFEYADVTPDPVPVPKQSRAGKRAKKRPAPRPTLLALDRPLSSYYGPAPAEVIAEVLAELFPCDTVEDIEDHADAMTVRDLAGQGMSDSQIAHKVGLSRRRVSALRKRFRIAAGSLRTCAA